MRIVGIVLAAGEGRRIGGPKALAPIGGTTFLSRVCELFVSAGVETLVVVLGAEAERVRSAVTLPERARVVVNAAWPSGMLSSICRGLDEAEGLAAGAVLLHPVDHPLVAAATILSVKKTLADGAEIAVPTWEGRRGHPGGFARAVFGEIRAASPDEGARSVLARHPERIVHLPGDAGCVDGIDLPEQLARLGPLPARPARG